MSDNASLAKIFVSIGGVTGGALKELTKCKSHKAKEMGSVDVTVAIGPHFGLRRKPGGHEVDLEIYREVGIPEIDWFDVQRQKKIFTVVVQDEGSGRRTAYRGTVSKIEPNTDAEGDLMDTVTIACTRRD